MMRKFFVSLLLGAGFALADVCAELCGSCENAPAGDGACAKVLAMCSCGAAGAGSVSEEVSSLGKSLYSAAMSGKLAAKVSFNGGAVERVDFEKVAGVAPSEEPQLSELSGKCAEICSAVAGVDPADKLAEVAESSCGCGTRLADSLKIEAFKTARLENAMLAADSVLKACPQQGVCLVGVTLRPDDFSVAKLERIGVNRAEKRRNALGDALFAAATLGEFSVKVVFMGDSLAELGSAAIPGVAEVPEPKLEPFSSECVEFCSAIEGVDPADKMVELTEKSCGCSARFADSLKIEAFKKARVENAKLAADSVVNFCSGSDVCRLQLKLKPEDFALDSIKFDESEELLKLKEARIEALSKALHESCFEGVCKVKVKLPETGTAEVSANAKGKIKEPEPKVEPLSEKCVEFCAELPADSASPMFKQIEGTCGCVAHERDSLALVDFRAKRDSNALAAATQLAELCYEKKTCEVEAALNKKTFALASYNLAGEAAIVAGDADEEEGETEGGKGTSTAFGVLAYGEGFSATYDYGDYGLKWSASGGFEVALGGFYRWYLGEHFSLQAGLNLVYSYIDLGNDTYGEAAAETSETLEETSTEADSETDSETDTEADTEAETEAETGEESELETSTETASYLFKYGLKEHKLSLEVPLQVRAGLEVASGVAVYATFLFTIRKPLWEYLKYEGSATAVSGSSAEWRGFDAWEFLGHLGAGAEFGRRVSAEVLFGLFDLGTAGDYVEQDFSWRIKADFAF